MQKVNTGCAQLRLLGTMAALVLIRLTIRFNNNNLVSIDGLLKLVGWSRTWSIDAEIWFCGSRAAFLLFACVNALRLLVRTRGRVYEVLMVAVFSFACTEWQAEELRIGTDKGRSGSFDHRMSFGAAVLMSVPKQIIHEEFIVFGCWKHLAVSLMGFSVVRWKTKPGILDKQGKQAHTRKQLWKLDGHFEIVNAADCR